MLEYPFRPNLKCLIVVLRGPRHIPFRGVMIS